MDIKDVPRAVMLAKVIQTADQILGAVDSNECGYRYIAVEVCGGGKAPIRLTFSLDDTGGGSALMDTIRFIRENSAEDLKEI